jgi:5-methylcytosine-specific restriction enzyme A
MRALPEWIADHDDQAIPPRVKLRIFERHEGRCPKCTRTLRPGQFAFDHIVALANGGKHCESNLQPLCNSPCHSSKTKADVAEKKERRRRKVKQLGLKRRRTIPGRRFNGDPIPSRWV